MLAKRICIKNYSQNFINLYQNKCCGSICVCYIIISENFSVLLLVYAIDE